MPAGGVLAMTPELGGDPAAEAAGAAHWVHTQRLARPRCAEPELTVVIPAYNEERRLPAALAALSGHVDIAATELIIVDDGSTDTTSALARNLLRPWARGRVIQLPRNRGKGYAVRTGVLASAGRSVLYMDADAATEVRCITEIVRALDHADIAVGSRGLAESIIEGAPRHRQLMGRMFNGLVRSCTELDLRDTQCGFKAFRGPVGKLVFSLANVDGFAFDVEILRLGKLLGLQMTEVPVAWHHVEGSKVRGARDALRMATDIARILGAVNRRPIACIDAIAERQAVTRALEGTSPNALMSWDGRTLEVVLPSCDTNDVANVTTRLAAHGILAQPLIRSGAELVARARDGQVPLELLGVLAASTEGLHQDCDVVRAGSAMTPPVSAPRQDRASAHGPSRASASPAQPRSKGRGITPLGLIIAGRPSAGTALLISALRRDARLGRDGIGLAQHPGQIGLAIQRGVPTLLTIQHPVPALASELVARSAARARRALRRYVRYYRRLLPYLGDVAVADIDHALADLESFISALNLRLDDRSPELDDATPSEALVRRSRPNNLTLDLTTSDVCPHPGLVDLLEEAEHLHGLFEASCR